MADEVQKPTTQIDAERFLAEEKARESGKSPDGDGTGRDFAVEGQDTSGYVGVNPEYMTHANDTEAPLGAESGVEKVLEKRARDGMKDIEASTARAGIHGRGPLLPEADPVEAVANRAAAAAPAPAASEAPKSKAAAPAKD